MKTHILFLIISLSMILFSCNPTDMVETEHFYYIENKTDADIDVALKRGGGPNPHYDKSFHLPINEKVQSHYMSGLEGTLAVDYDSAYVYYKDFVLIDSLKNIPGLLNDASYIQFDVKEHRKITSYYYVFTIDAGYIKSHTE